MRLKATRQAVAFLRVPGGDTDCLKLHMSAWKALPGRQLCAGQITVLIPWMQAAQLTDDVQIRLLSVGKPFRASDAICAA